MTLKGQHMIPQGHTRHLTMVTGGDLLGPGGHGHHLILMGGQQTELITIGQIKRRLVDVVAIHAHAPALI